MNVPPRIKRLLAPLFTALYLAGAGYYLSMLYLRRPGEFGDTPHPLETALGPIHLALALLLLPVLGMVWDQHMRIARIRGEGRLSGWLFPALIGALVLSAIGILYGPEVLVRRAEQIHPWLGLSLLPAVLIHSGKRLWNPSRK